MAIMSDQRRCRDGFTVASDQDRRIRSAPRQRDIGRGIVPRPRQAAALPERDDSGDVGVVDRRDRKCRDR